MSEARGGNAVSEPQSFFFAGPDEYLTRVEVRAGAWIDAIRFHSNKRSSEWMGGSGGDLYCLTPPSGKRIRGLFGTAGHYVGSIGLQLSGCVIEENILNQYSKYFHASTLFFLSSQ